MGTKEESNFKKESITSGDFKNISLIDFSIPSKNSKQHTVGNREQLLFPSSSYRTLSLDFLDIMDLGAVLLIIQKRCLKILKNQKKKILLKQRLQPQILLLIQQFLRLTLPSQVHPVPEQVKAEMTPAQQETMVRALTL